MHRYAETRLFRRQHTAAEGRMPQVTAFAVAEAAVVPAEAAAVAALAGAVVAVVPPQASFKQQLFSWRDFFIM